MRDSLLWPPCIPWEPTQSESSEPCVAEQQKPKEKERERCACKLTCILETRARVKRAKRFAFCYVAPSSSMGMDHIREWVVRDGMGVLWTDERGPPDPHSLAHTRLAVFSACTFSRPHRYPHTHSLWYSADSDTLQDSMERSCALEVIYVGGPELTLLWPPA
jgi:hypothetical protein